MVLMNGTQPEKPQVANLNLYTYENPLNGDGLI